MVMITKLLYLLSGVIILATGVYIEVRFVDLIPDVWRWVAAGGAVAYSLIQFYRVLATEYAGASDNRSIKISQEFNA